jgi:transmembrane sensor
MEFTKMIITRLIKILSRSADHLDDKGFEHNVVNNPKILKEFLFVQNIWEEAADLKAFDQFDANQDWKVVREKVSFRIPVNYHKLSWNNYFLRIAALMILTFGLTFGVYRIIINHPQTDFGFVTAISDNQVKDVILPDGSLVTLNAGSTLNYRNGFGTQYREVILDGEALFSVVPDAAHPFKVFTGESVVEVTGTKFSIRESDESVKVSVLSGRVLLFSANNIENKISITANQSGYLLSNNKLMVKEGLSENILSWKTGRLIFDQTPMDSALIDIAHHFRKELQMQTTLKEEITAEFQDQPLGEILNELKLVAGLQFDTTGTALIVRK